MKIKSKQSLCFLLSFCLLSGNTLAELVKPHTWHNVSSTNGTWQASLQMINQDGYFVGRDTISASNFTISQNKSFDYGFGFNVGADFDIAYSLTLVQQRPQTARQFTSKACVYVITASGPARPDVRVSSFNGAKCDWKVQDGVGEDFIVG